MFQFRVGYNTLVLGMGWVQPGWVALGWPLQFINFAKVGRKPGIVRSTRATTRVQYVRHPNFFSGPPVEAFFFGPNVSE